MIDSQLIQQQRDALSDLLELAEQCQAESSALRQKYNDDRKELDQQFQKTEKISESDFEELRQQANEEHETKLAKIEKVYKRDKAELKRRYVESHEKTVEQADKNEKEARESHQQALWMADSMLEASKKQLEEDRQICQSRLAEVAELRQNLKEYGARYGLSSEPSDSQRLSKVISKAGELESVMEQIQDSCTALKKLQPFILFRYWIPTAVAAALGLAAMLGVLALLQWSWTFWSVLPAVILTGAGLAFNIKKNFEFKNRLREEFDPLSNDLHYLEGDIQSILIHTESAEEKEIPRRTEQQKRDIESANRRFKPMLESLAEVRRDQIDALEKWHVDLTQKIESRYDKELAEENKRFEQHMTRIKTAHDPREHQARYEKYAAEMKKQFDGQTKKLEKKWAKGVKSVCDRLDPITEVSAKRDRAWSDRSWRKWKPPRRSAPVIRLGDLSVPTGQLFDSSGNKVPESITCPALVNLPQQSPLLLQTGRSGRPDAVSVIQSALARLFTTLPPGRVRFNIIDPVGRGQSFAGFMHLADYEEDLVGRRIWTEAEHIEKQLRDLTEHMENVIQKYLRNEFETIEQYNKQAGELAEPYRCLVIADFPVNFNEDAARRLVSIAKSGPRCGVYVLMTLDTREALPGGIEAADLAGSGVNLIHDGERFVCEDDLLKHFELTLDPPPDGQLLVDLLQVVGENAKDWDRVEVPFESISPPEKQIWSGDCSVELSVPMGRTGATRLQPMTLGKGVAQHVLIAGKTGSGKSTLLHVVITNLAQWFGPDEVEFYLVDFKKGVEFKTYATHELPHVQAVAIESDREFGVSVLQRLYERMQVRGDLYRKLGVQELDACRRACKEQGINQPLPRILLIIDEFQEFFSEDDKLAQDAGLMLDRLVRQGRAFGIHVILGSQTLAGAYGLARSTMGQMAVRIALQCSEADAQVIMADTNSAPRLLSRPGEALYNDAGGMMESNSLFQISWLADSDREQRLKAMAARAAETGFKRHDPLIVFEGNAPAELPRNTLLADLLESLERPEPPSAPLAWLGEPITIKDPTAARFGRHNGANVLMIGQRDESAMAMFGSSLLSLAAQHRPDAASFYVFDSGAADFPGCDLLARIAEQLPHEVHQVERLSVDKTLQQLHDTMQQRLDADESDAPGVFIFLYGLQRFRTLAKKEDDFSLSMSDESASASPDKVFKELIRQGPLVGMHIITWCDTPNALDRIIDRQTLREFDTRILFQMSANDSSNLVDSPVASKLGFYRALFNSEEQGLLEKFRPYSLPDMQWLADACAKLEGKQVAQPGAQPGAKQGVKQGEK